MIMNKTWVMIVLFLLSIGSSLIAQDKPVATIYPKSVGYLSVVHPLITLDKNGISTNFKDYYIVGFPTGIHIYTNEKFGYSLEVVPFIKVINGTSKVYNILFHPGLIFRFPKKWTLYTRLAFETSGRYGFTPAISKVVYKSKKSNVFLTLPIPLRFGNELAASAGIAILAGLTF